MAKIVVLGAGGFGTSLAVALHKAGEEVLLWSAFEQELADLRRYGENKRLLPGVAVDASIVKTTDPSCVQGADLIVFAVPSFAVRTVCKAVKGFVDTERILANVGKGFEEETGKRLSEVLTEEFPENPIVVVSGPSHAEEIARGVPTTLVAASIDHQAAEAVQDLLMNTNLRLYVNDDVIGVELGGALKNIIAVCAGICDGLELGDNSKAALMTRGIAEIARLGVAMGAQVGTFAGLTGFGDLIVTCTSMHSRNRRAGILIGQGLSADVAIARVGMTVEGCMACRAAHRLAKHYGVEMPIVEQLYAILTKEKEIRIALNDLMSRPQKHEVEEIWVG